MNNDERTKKQDRDFTFITKLSPYFLKLIVNILFIKVKRRPLDKQLTSLGVYLPDTPNCWDKLVTEYPVTTLLTFAHLEEQQLERGIGRVLFRAAAS